MLGAQESAPNSPKIRHLRLDLVLHMQQDHFQHQDQKVRRRYTHLGMGEVPGNRSQLPRYLRQRRRLHRAAAIRQPAPKAHLLSHLLCRLRRRRALLETTRLPIVRVLLPPRLLRLRSARFLAFWFPTRPLSILDPRVRPDPLRAKRTSLLSQLGRTQANTENPKRDPSEAPRHQTRIKDG